MKTVTRRPEAPEKSPRLENSAGFLLRKAYQRNMSVFNEFCTYPDLTSVQAAALIALNDFSPCSLAELGRMAAMDPATTRGVVDRLRKRELVRTEPGNEDKREVIVHLEPRGQKIADDFDRSIGPDIAERTLAPLNVAERIAFNYILRKICGEMND